MSMPSPSACLACLLLLLGSALAGTPQERLVADHAAWHSARQGYEERLATGVLDAAERRDYEAFLDDLAGRVLAGCVELQSLGLPVPDGVACPEPSAATVTRAPETAPRGATGEADRAALDAELGASLGSFDELLLREQDRVRAARPRVDSRDPETASSAASGRDGRASAASGGAQAGAEASGEGGQGASGDAQGATATAAREGAAGQGASAGLPGAQGGSEAGGGQGDPGRGGLGAPAGSGTAAASRADLPDPSGDDVVARQLREAAEAERDPELRERLWDEYRRYRRGIN